MNYTYNGETKSLSEWSRYIGINYHTLCARIYKRNWSFEDAISIEVRDNRLCKEEFLTGIPTHRISNDNREIH